MQRFFHFLMWSLTSSATFIFIGILSFFGLNQSLFYLLFMDLLLEQPYI